MNEQSDEAGGMVTEEPNPSGQQRGFHRMAVRWDALLSAGTDGDGSPLSGDCLVLDISPGGARVQTPDPLPAETPVALTLARGGSFDGKVAWQQGSFFGIAFARTYDDFLAA